VSKDDRRVAGSVRAVIAEHRAAGRAFEAAGVTSFVRAAGHGEPIVMMHGLPSSSFLYRKVISELASQGFRAMAFDLPGLGLADRPTDLDYTFDGLARFAVAAVDALGVDRLHLVGHDAGGPVGFGLASIAPERVRSLTILNTVVAMDAVPRGRWSSGHRNPVVYGAVQRPTSRGGQGSARSPRLARGAGGG
jgi:haloalkane dehalogenase